MAYRTLIHGDDIMQTESVGPLIVRPFSPPTPESLNPFFIGIITQTLKNNFLGPLGVEWANDALRDIAFLLSCRGLTLTRATQQDIELILKRESTLNLMLATMVTTGTLTARRKPRSLTGLQMDAISTQELQCREVLQLFSYGFIPIVETIKYRFRNLLSPTHRATLSFLDMSSFESGGHSRNIDIICHHLMTIACADETMLSRIEDWNLPIESVQATILHALRFYGLSTYSIAHIRRGLPQIPEHVLLYIAIKVLIKDLADVWVVTDVWPN